jgi:hypothetical protein
MVNHDDFYFINLGNQNLNLHIDPFFWKSEI